MYFLKEKLDPQLLWTLEFTDLKYQLTCHIQEFIVVSVGMPLAAILSSLDNHNFQSHLFLESYTNNIVQQKSFDSLLELLFGLCPFRCLQHPQDGTMP